MIIALSEDCPIFHRSNEIHLQRFLHTIAFRWHAVVLPSPDRLQHVLPLHLWNLYGSLISREYRTAVNSSQSWVSHRDCGGCNAEKIAAFYSLPTLVVVENAQTDGEWLKAIADQLRPALSRRFDGHDAMIAIRQAGGIGEIPKEVKRLGAPYVQTRPHESIPLRVIALADSDAVEPGKFSDGAREVEKAANEIGATCHILQKRTIENYIPDDSLLAYSEHRRDRRFAVEQVVSLANPARDHYPLKAGLDEGRVSSIYPKGIVLGLGLGDFMHDFLSKFSYSLSAGGIKGRDGVGELDVLMEKLERNL